MNPFKRLFGSKKKTAKRTYRAPQAKHIKGGFMPRDTHERVPSALSVVRARARDLVHNSPHASRAISLLTSTIIGTGIHVGISGDKAYAEAFTEWASSTAVDYDGRLDFYGKQSLMCRMMLEAGEAFEIIRHVRDWKTGYIFPQLQSVDPALLAENAMPHFKDNVVTSGVETDKSGRVVGYHFHDPSDQLNLSANTIFLKKEEVIHVYEMLYPGQLRGIPRGSQALIAADDVTNFMQTMIIKAKTEACLSVAVVRNPQNEDQDIGDDDDDEEEEEGAPRIQKLTPGGIYYLEEGEDIRTISPSSSGGYIDYIRISLQSVAISYRVSYSMLSGDLINVSFSALKSDRDIMHIGCAETQQHTIIPVIRQIERLFREDYELRDGNMVNVAINIIPPARSSLDPQKEASARATDLANGITTIRDIVLANGKDPDAHFDELQQQAEELKKRGISVSFTQPSAIEKTDEELELEREELAEIENERRGATLGLVATARV